MVFGFWVSEAIVYQGFLLRLLLCIYIKNNIDDYDKYAISITLVYLKSDFFNFDIWLMTINEITYLVTAGVVILKFDRHITVFIMLTIILNLILVYLKYILCIRHFRILISK